MKPTDDKEFLRDLPVAFGSRVHDARASALEGGEVPGWACDSQGRLGEPSLSGNVDDFRLRYSRALRSSQGTGATMAPCNRLDGTWRNG